MSDAEIQREFDRKVKEIIAEILAGERAAIARARELLENMRRDVIADLAQSGRTDFELAYLRQIKAGIERRIAELSRALESQLKVEINKAFDLGNQLVDEPVKVALGVNPVIGVSREVAMVASEFSASLIKDLTASAQAAIDNLLRRGALGAITVQDAIREIGMNLTDSKTFASITARAETIFRTEVLRIQSIATQARMTQNREAMRRANWELGKRWLATPDRRVRLAHLAAMGQERAVDEPFTVGGEELMYPRDPAGSAANTINCRCVSQPSVKRIFKIDRTKKFER